jgi:hypothetical protein
LSVIVKDLQQNEKYGPVNEMWYDPGPPEKLINLHHRPYYITSPSHSSHKYIPSYRHKVEPFNSIPVFKFAYSGNNREEHNALMFKKNEYLKEFVRPFNINLPDLKNCLDKFKHLEGKIQFNSSEFHKYITSPYLNRGDIKDANITSYLEIVDSIVDMIPHVNHNTYPNLLMALFYDYNVNDKRIWISLEQEILNNLHHYNIKDICKIYFIAYLSSPKYSTIKFRQILHSEISKQLGTMSLEELFYVCLGFRMSKDRNLYDKIAEQFIKRKEAIKQDEKNLPKNLANMFYSYANNYPKYQAVDTFHPHRELVDRFVETFEDDLNNSILKMDQFEAARLSTSLYILKYEYVDLFVK